MATLRSGGQILLRPWSTQKPEHCPDYQYLSCRHAGWFALFATLPRTNDLNPHPWIPGSANRSTAWGL